MKETTNRKSNFLHKRQVPSPKIDSARIYPVIPSVHITTTESWLSLWICNCMFLIEWNCASVQSKGALLVKL